MEIRETLASCENLSFCGKRKNIKIRAFQRKAIVREQKTTLFLFAQRNFQRTIEKGGKVVRL